MRILLASDFYKPFVGGAERQVQLLGAALADRGHEVSVATVWHDGLAERAIDDGIELRRLHSFLLEQPWFSTDPTHRFHPPFPVPGVVRGLRAMIAEQRPAVVHANGWIAYSCAAAVAGTSIPLLLSVRDYGYSCAVRSLMQYDRRICSGPSPGKCLKCAADDYGFPKAVAAVAGVGAGRSLLTRRVTAIHAVSRYVRSIVLRDLIGQNETQWRPPVVRIPDISPPAPLDAYTSASDPETVHDLPPEPFILFVGQLRGHKGIHWLIEAYQQLVDPPPLVLIGTLWPDTPKVFPPGVVVVGEATHEVVLSAWERSLFGVVPSIWPDPLPGVVREAMSRGKPVVGSNIGGIPDMVDDGRTGLLVPAGDVRGLATAMARLLADRALRERLGKAAQEATAPFTAEAVAGRFEDLYVQMAAGGPAPQP